MTMMGWLTLALVVAGLLLVVAIYIVVRAVLGWRRLDDEDSRPMLDRRFAVGEIAANEYRERLAALRREQPVDDDWGRPLWHGRGGVAPRGSRSATRSR